MKSDRVNLVAPASPVQSLVQYKTATEKVDPARKFKCTTAARVIYIYKLGAEHYKNYIII